MNLIQERWRQGNPIGKIEMKQEIITRDDCAEGTQFYNSYLDPKRNGSGYVNWINRVMAREGWSFRHNSVGQTLPEDWRQKAEDNVARINKKFKDDNVDIVRNADQTFVQFFMEEEYVAAPTGTKRIGGKVSCAFLQSLGNFL